MVCKWLNHDLIGVRTDVKIIKSFYCEFCHAFTISRSRPGGFYSKCEYTVVECNFLLLLSLNIKLLATSSVARGGGL